MVYGDSHERNIFLKIKYPIGSLILSMKEKYG
jgi:hypothetical protein